VRAKGECTRKAGSKRKVNNKTMKACRKKDNDCLPCWVKLKFKCGPDVRPIPYGGNQR